ncbi:hypothetical protein HY793_03630 [Candidatus Desantisbacteria bacterium]|nr:hypothetical protein [Candidatus Desantisbacteria bacterium]
MNMMENVKKVVQELILPELGIIKAENQEIKTILQFINQRVNDTNIQLVDQSRRIDELRMELKKNMSELRIELKEEISMNTIRINEINKRMDRLYEVIVRRDEHEMLGIRVSRIDQKITEMEMEIHKIAA